MPLVRCGGCGHPPPPESTLRRGRCVRCYDNWVRSRPIGVGAACVGCGNRRREQLRHYEVGLRLNAAGGRWTLLCHNCAATADTYQPAPRSVDALCQRLARDRRWNERRHDRVYRPPAFERRDGEHANERRLDLRDIFDATDLAEELVIEMEADFEPLADGQPGSMDDMTGIHMAIPPSAVDDSESTGLPSDELFK